MFPNSARWRFWERWSTGQRAVATLLGVLTAAAVGHQAAFWGWYIEDAAISFAYAKHLVEGEGLVTFPGGERVEGYSNFTWVMLLAVFHALGADGFRAADPLQLVLVALTLPIVFLTVREAVPDTPVPALAAAAVLAANSQFAHWGGSGLENALFSFLMALAIWRTLVEQRSGHWPWSALVWFLLSISRPEAILYAAIAGFLTMVYHLASGRGLTPTFRWLATFFGPWVIYQALRFWYFAWEFPNTYYAKMNNKEPDPFAWNKRGWKYVRNWAHTNGTGYLLPVYVLGLLSGRGWRVLAGIAAVFIAGFVVQFGSNARLLFPLVVSCTWAMFYASWRSGSGRPTPRATGLSVLAMVLVSGTAELAILSGLEVAEPPTPSWWSEVPSYALMALAASLPLMAIGTRAWRLRVLSWSLASAGLFFAIYVQADWMSNWRWMSLPAVPMALLFGLGVQAVGDAVDDLFRAGPTWHLPGWGAVIVALCGFIVPNVYQSTHAKRDTHPWSVRKRVEYMQGVARRLHMRERVSLLDVDMGGHMYWSGFELHDIAGLVDVPLAHHKFERAFVREYIFEEVQPDFAHVHGGWASSSRIPSHSEWRRDYVEIPGYPAGVNQFHIGNHIRRDLLFDERWPSADRRVTLDDGLVLAGWTLDSPVASPKRKFYLEVGLDSAPRGIDDTFRVIAFVSNDSGALASWDLPPGYDWVSPADWGDGEVFHGRFALPIPETLPLGSYDLGFVFFNADGEVVAPEPEPRDEQARRRWARAENVFVGETGTARLAVGELRFQDVLTVQSPEARNAVAESLIEEARVAAQQGNCRQAETLHDRAISTRPAERRWQAARAVSLNPTLASCWILTAREAQRDEAVLRLTRAREIDRHHPDLAAAVRPIADALEDEGYAALELEDWPVAYTRLSEALQLDPARSWARRDAETARAKRLGFDAESKAAREEERAQRRKELAERAEQRKRERELQREKDVGEAPALPQHAEGK